MTSAIWLPLLLLAQDPVSVPALVRPDEPLPPTPTEVRLEGLTGAVRRAPVADLSLTDPRDVDAVFVRFGPSAPLPEAAGRVGLVGGGGFTADVRGGEGERLDLALPGGSPIGLDVGWVRSLEFPGRFPEDGAAPTPAEEGDRLYLARARGVDRVDGFVAGFSAEGVRFESRVGERTHPWEEVVALYVEPLDTPPPAERAVPVSVTLRGGGVLAGDLTGLDARGLRLGFAGGVRTLGLAEVGEIAIDDGSFAFLSTLEPSDLGPLNPFDPPGTEPLGMGWPPRMDAGVDGGPLQVGGRAWARGIGVHAPSRVTWTLEPGAWKELRVRCGLDDAVADEGRRGGTVRFRVLLDGKAAWESPVLRAGEPVLVPEPIALGTARTLVLEVDPVDDWVLDRAAWLRPLLVKP